MDVIVIKHFFIIVICILTYYLMQKSYKGY